MHERLSDERQAIFLAFFSIIHTLIDHAYFRLTTISNIIEFTLNVFKSLLTPYQFIGKLISTISYFTNWLC